MGIEMQKNKVKRVCFQALQSLVYTLMLLGVVTFVNQARAGIVASSTRLVYKDDKSEQTLMLANTNKYPVIVQTWTDNGDTSGTSDQANAPFIPVPSVFRMEPAGIKGMKVIYRGDRLPQDRESVYWLNIYEIPPIAKKEEGAHIELAINTQLKIFYRPGSLSDDPQLALKKMKFTVQDKNGVQVIHCQNDTPFYASFGQMSVDIDGKKYFSDQQMDMMTAPFSGHDYRILIPNSKVSLHGQMLDFILYDDHGKSIKHVARLQ
nr:molecular chaperone [uncultured Enterobacter sp.]